MPITDKTLVVWASPADLDQRGGSALTLDDLHSNFDGVVFGEIAARRWMPGSENHGRTLREQDDWPEETAGAEVFVQLAITYRDQEVVVYRDGRLYAQYAMAEPPRSFGPRAAILFGRRHLDAGDPRRSFAGRIREARVYDRALTAGAVAALVPREIGDQALPWAWWSFADEGLREKTGRFDEIKLIGDVRLADGCLHLAGDGAAVLCRASGAADPDAADPDAADPDAGVLPGTWPASSPVPEEAVRTARYLREQLLADPHRPTWHFCVPEDMGLPGDPNGAFYCDGRYHLMYLYNRSGAAPTWGHISSHDLVHWRHHRDALGPGDGDEGCFSGGAFLDGDGTAWLSYWMLGAGGGIGLACSTGPDFDVWTKLKTNPVIASTEWGITATQDGNGQPLLLGSADPSNIWEKGGRYYMLTGNLLVLNKVGREPDAPLSEQGDRLYLFASHDLQTWHYEHVFYERRPEWTDRSEDNMCPSFLPLPTSARGGKVSGKHLLLFISHNKGCQYYVGEYRDDRFFPASHGRMTWVDNTYFAPEALIDGRGRQIMWSWLTDNPPGEKEKGWSGVYGLPRSLWLGEDGTLRLAPVEELEVLRGGEKTWEGIELTDGRGQILEDVDGASCELRLEIAPGQTGRCGLKVRASGDGREETVLYYDRQRQELVFDATRSGPVGRTVVERAPLALDPEEDLVLRVFVDRSIVEVFANDRQAIGRRVYPANPDSVGLCLFATEGTARVRRAVAWRMEPSNPF